MGPLKVSVVLAVLVCTFTIALSLELIAQSLPGRLYPSQKYLTVSGTESGGVMAQMMHFTHAKHIKGCAVYSTTFYRCSTPNGDPSDYQWLCTKNSPIPPEQGYSVNGAVSDLSSYESNQLIDSLKFIRDSYLYVYCGLQNAQFTADQQLKVIALYEHYLDSPYLIKARVQDTSEQLRVINTRAPYQSPCPKMRETDGTLSPNCTNISVPAEALEWLLGKYIHYANPFYPQIRYIHLEPLRSFNQTEFIDGLEKHGLDEIGYYYVPRQCMHKSYSSGYGKGQPCLVHIYFHGCNQGREFLGTSHVIYSNYLDIAEQNSIIMLFPQVLSNPDNPGGCWDYPGWSGANYATKDGAQIQAIWRMIERLLYIRTNSYPSPGSPSSYYRAGGSSYSPSPASDSYSDNNSPSSATYSDNSPANDYSPSNATYSNSDNSPANSYSSSSPPYSNSNSNPGSSYSPSSPTNNNQGNSYSSSSPPYSNSDNSPANSYSSSSPTYSPANIYSPSSATYSPGSSYSPSSTTNNNKGNSYSSSSPPYSVPSNTYNYNSGSSGMYGGGSGTSGYSPSSASTYSSSGNSYSSSTGTPYSVPSNTYNYNYNSGSSSGTYSPSTTSYSSSSGSNYSPSTSTYPNVGSSYSPSMNTYPNAGSGYSPSTNTYPNAGSSYSKSPSSYYPNARGSYNQNYYRPSGNTYGSSGSGSGSAYRPASGNYASDSTGNKDESKATSYSTYNKVGGSMKRCSSLTGVCEEASPFYANPYKPR